MTERERERERERKAETQAEGEGKKQGPCREPDMGLDPWSPGSHPGLQAALNLCATGAAQYCIFKYKILIVAVIDFYVLTLYCFMYSCLVHSLALAVLL